MDTNFGTLPDYIKREWSEKRYDECLTSCIEILEHEPENGPASIYIGYILKYRGSYEQSIPYFNVVLKKNPYLYFIWVELGNCYLHLQMYDKALDAYKEALQLDNEITEAWVFSCACFYFKFGKEAALQYLDMIESKIDNKSIILLIKGILHEHTGEDDKALFSYIESQLSERSGDNIAGERIYNLLNQKN